jgi:hypothetical protein
LFEQVTVVSSSEEIIISLAVLTDPQIGKQLGVFMEAFQSLGSIVGSAADEILKKKGSFIGRKRFNPRGRHGAMVDLSQDHASIVVNARLVGQR